MPLSAQLIFEFFAFFRGQQTAVSRITIRVIRAIRGSKRVRTAVGDPEDLGLEMEELWEPVISPDGRRNAFTVGETKTEVWVMENFLPKDKVAVK